MKIKEIVDYLEKWAPLSLQECYDNSGLLVGNEESEIDKAIICLDVVESVIEEAIEKEAGLIIAHHPIIFGGLKRLNGKHYIERTLIKALRNNIAIYAIHTNLDNIKSGVNAKIASKLHLQNVKILSPKMNSLYKLITFVPLASKEEVLQALFSVGAGNIGNYSEASFSVEGIGSFKPNKKAKPAIGKVGYRENVSEAKIEVLIEKFQINSVLSALFESHPYEEVAYDLISLDNISENIGSGMIGELPEKVDLKSFLQKIKHSFSCKCVKYTGDDFKMVQRIAICGGSGSFLFEKAKVQKADVFMSADFKYHDYFEATPNISIVDIGHYESEQFTSELIKEKLNKKFSKFAFLLTEMHTNPIKYFI